MQYSITSNSEIKDYWINLALAFTGIRSTTLVKKKLLKAIIVILYCLIISRYILVKGEKYSGRKA